MNLQFEILTDSDGAEMLALSKLVDTGSKEFYVSREPDFFALARSLGQYTYYGVKASGRLVGMMGVTRQLKWMQNTCREVHYMHDTRIHPDFQKGRAYYLLLQGVRQIYYPNSDLFYSVVLDTNQSKSLLMKSGIVNKDTESFGTMIHMGFPMFSGRRKLPAQVKEITAELARNFYQAHAPRIEFAPADEQKFDLDNGFFLGCFRSNVLVAIAKVVDQSASRNIVAARSRSLVTTALHGYCRLRAYAGFPSRGEVFRHLYLSYYVSIGGEFRSSFVQYVRSRCADRYTYLFTGMSAVDANMFTEPFLIRFTSSFIAYGEVAEKTKIDSYELTLI